MFWPIFVFVLCFFFLLFFGVCCMGVYFLVFGYFFRVYFLGGVEGGGHETDLFADSS